MNTSYKTALRIQQVWHGYSVAQGNTVISIFQYSISRNTKCAIKAGFANPVTYVLSVLVADFKLRFVLLIIYNLDRKVCIHFS